MPERLILIDASALIYRAYFAIPANFSTKDGLKTNAIYGFATMFAKILAGRRPERGAAVFDSPGPTHREQRYAGYKAQRPPMDSELRQQLEWIDRLVDAHKFPRVSAPGYEADDVIGTLTRQAVARGMEVHIVSGDKDFAQLIDDRVRMIDTIRDVSYDPELVKKKWGVPPAQFVDYLALVGDASDNIPGVPGIGPKTAQKLLAEHGDLATLLAHAALVPGKNGERLREHHDQALLSQALARIDCSAPLPVALDDLVLAPVDTSALNPLYKRLEFYSLLSEEAVATADEGDGETACEVVQDAKALDRLLARLPPPGGAPVAIVAITDAPSPARGALAALALAIDAALPTLVPIDCAGGQGAAAIDGLRAWLEDPTRTKVSHDAKALWVALARRGVRLAGVTGDTQLESFLVDPNKLIPHRLDQISKEYLQAMLPPAKRILGAGQAERRFADLDPPALAAWAGRQVRTVALAHPKVRARLDAEGHRSYLEDVELPLSWLLGRMELDGIGVDGPDLARAGEEFARRMAEHEAQVHALAGKPFNLGSTKQLGAVLFEDLGLPVIKKTKTGYSTDAEVLEKLAPKHPIAAHLLEHRKLAKLINTYTEVLQAAIDPTTGRVHATFQQTTGVSGRLITTDPDLQRTPVKTPEGLRIREAFKAGPGQRMISADWSQIELRLLAHVSGDPRLVEAFAQGLDVHARTAAQLFGIAVEAVDKPQRGVGKLVNFATIYGQGAMALSQIIGVSRKEAQAYIDGYFAYYEGVRAWLDRTIAQAHRDGYVTTLLGRRRYVSELSSNNPQDRQAGERIAANTPIQGSAADLCKLAMLAIDRDFRANGLATKMVLQIHDELLFEGPVAEVERVSAIVRERMEHAHPLSVPLVVDVGVGASWAQAH